MECDLLRWLEERQLFQASVGERASELRNTKIR